MPRINKKIIIFLVAFCFTCFFVTPVLAGRLGLDATRDAAELAGGDIPLIIGNIIGAGLSLVGVLFFALTLYGGILWMLAQGNQEREKKALNTIVAAIIGIIIVFSSYAITNFVFKGIEGRSALNGSNTSSVGQCLPGEENYANVCQVICVNSGNSCVFNDDPDINTVCKERCKVAEGVCVVYNEEYSMETECKKITSETDCKKMKDKLGLCEWK